MTCSVCVPAASLSAKGSANALPTYLFQMLLNTSLLVNLQLTLSHACVKS